MKDKRLNVNSGKFMQLEPTVTSSEFATTGTLTADILASVTVPTGAYVTQVALLCTAAIGSQDLDVGDGDNVERFLTAIVSASANALLVAPHNDGATTAGGVVAGKYYSASDTIDVSSDATGADAAGSAKLLVWYYV